VFICGRNGADVEAALQEIRAAGGTIDGIAGDIGRLADVRRIVGVALDRFGAIDVLVNNASILGPRATITDYATDAWEEVIRINLTGVFLMTREVLPSMLARRSGSIINLSSGVGRVGKGQWGAYAVSKAGLENFTQVLADEVRSAGIRVNAVNPAATRTPMRAAAYPAEDPGSLPTPDEVVPIFIYLATDGAQEITGQSLNARDWLGKII
jgi:NAD(P)-dependent dehydrogenase (short-subunit alcohol dehydrogenase family)